MAMPFKVEDTAEREPATTIPELRESLFCVEDRAGMLRDRLQALLDRVQRVNVGKENKQSVAPTPVRNAIGEIGEMSSRTMSVLSVCSNTLYEIEHELFGDTGSGEAQCANGR